VHDIAVRLLR